MFRRCRWALKGEFAANVFHDSNPEIGAPYTTDDRKMRDDEFEDFLKSVKGWHLDKRSGAIERTFVFPTPTMAHQFMGRVFAFSYFSDRYARVRWHKDKVYAKLYSGQFNGITKLEARLAAFMSDQYNLLRKATAQQDRFLKHIPTTSAAGFVRSEIEAENKGQEESGTIEIDIDTTGPSVSQENIDNHRADPVLKERNPHWNWKSSQLVVGCDQTTGDTLPRREQ